MKRSAFCAQLAISIFVSFVAYADVTVHETNGVRIQILRPEGRRLFKINDELMFVLYNASLGTNVVFIPSDLGVLVKVRCIDAQGKILSKKAKYQGLGGRFDTVPLQVSKRIQKYRLSSHVPVVFRSRAGDIATEQVHGQNASRELFIPEEAFEFPQGDEFVLTIHLQVVFQRAGGVTFEVLRFPPFQLHMRK